MSWRNYRSKNGMQWARLTSLWLNGSWPNAKQILQGGAKLSPLLNYLYEIEIKIGNERGDSLNMVTKIETHLLSYSEEYFQRM